MNIYRQQLMTIRSFSTIPEYYIDIWIEEIEKNKGVYELKQIEHFWNYGKHYGYPECCIHQFIIYLAIRDVEHPNKNIEVSEGTGYIPCDFHTEKILEGHVKLCGLIDTYRRYSKHSFPTDSRG